MYNGFILKHHSVPRCGGWAVGHWAHEKNCCKSQMVLTWGLTMPNAE